MNHTKNENDIVLDGESLTIEQVTRLARDPSVRVSIDPNAMERVRRCREHIEAIVKQYHESLASPGAAITHVYGVTTGFGEFKNEPVRPEQLVELQQNILLSHASGAGSNANALDPSNYFAADVVRAALVLRLNALLKGFSGVRVELVQFIAAMINGGVFPLVPTRGSVGSSGDLCPLAHLFVGMLGQGKFYIVRSAADVSRGTFREEELHGGDELFSQLSHEAITPSYKEGLALTNGATFSAALLALAVHDAESLAQIADVATAMSVEAICGRTRAYDPAIHDARNMTGQRDSAANIRSLLSGSQMIDRARTVQDAYSLRCSPQVHGASRDAIAHAKMVVLAEMNAATDNPLFFPELSRDPSDIAARRARGDREDELGDTNAFSAGNFHGQPIALAADFLAIAVSELANIAERRTQLLLDKAHNRNLPANLIARRGVNSGFMLSQYLAAGLVSENKVLSHPASVDSIPTSANSEDHNAMASVAALKLRTVVSNVQAVLAINLLVAAQAIDWRIGLEISPNAPTPSTTHELDIAQDKFAAADDEARRFEEAVGEDRRGALAARLGVGTRIAYRAVREVSAPLLKDRMLEPEIRAVRAIVADDSLRMALSRHSSDTLRPIKALRSD